MGSFRQMLICNGETRLFYLPCNQFNTAFLLNGYFIKNFKISPIVAC